MFDGSGYSLNDEYLSSWSGGSEFTLNVTCSRINDDTHSLWYNGGGHNAMVPETSYADGHSTIITADMPDNHAYDADGTVWEFTGYRLDYANGPWMYVEARDEICLYTDATLTAQWKDVTDQYTTPVPPSVTIVGDSASKEFDGAPLSAQHYSITAGDLGGYTLGVTYNEITDPDTVPNISSYALFNADGSLAFDQAALEASGTFIVEPGTLTVTAAPVLQNLTIRGITATVDATSADQVFFANQIAADGFTNGYQAVGLLEGDSIVDNGIVSGSGSNSFEVIVNTGAVQIMRGGEDVTSLYDIHGENGRITVNAFVPAPTPVIPAVTVEAPSASKPFDGTPLTMAAGSDVTVVEDEQGITYRIVFSYAGGSRTEIGTTTNEVTSCVINDVNDQPLFSEGEIQAARDSGRLRIMNGTLTVADPSEKQTLVVTGITTTVTVKTADQTVTLAECSAEGYTNGYKATGLFDGHEVRGENIVSGQGTAPGFDTVVNANAIHVYNGETDVTTLYNISAVNGYVTITVEKPDTPPEPDKPTVPTLTLRGLDASKEYDGTPLTMQGEKGYLLSGTIGEYKIAVTYNTITEIGSKPTISSYELQDAQGKTVFTQADLDASENFTVETLGTLTITKPEPTIPKATLTVQPATKEYDGTALTRENNGNVEL